MKKRIFTDFDGPIMDVSERYYQVYLYCLEKICKPDQVINTLSKSEFWELKRSQIPEKEIANLIKENSMLQNNSIEEVVSFVKQVISENQKVIEDIEKNPNAIKFLVGQVMKISKGKVNPKVAEEELRKLLNINN